MDDASCGEDSMIDQKTQAPLDIRERMVSAIKKNCTESCEKVLQELKEERISEETFWENVERQLNRPVLYYAALKHAWKVINILILNFSEKHFVPIEISLRKNSDNIQSEIGMNCLSDNVLRKKTNLAELSCEGKLQESLEMMIRNQDLSLIEKFLRCIPNSETRRKLISTTRNELGNFLIHIAAKNNFTELLTYVLPDSHPNERNLMNETALHVAAECGCIENTKMIMKYEKTDRDAATSWKDVQGNTPLHSSVKARHPNSVVVSLLSTSYKKKLKVCSVDCLDDGVSKASLLNKSGRTPLHVAAIHMSSNRNDCIDIIRSLKLFDPDVKDNNEETALHIAARIGNFGVLEAMLDVFYGLQKDVYKHVKNKDGHSLLDVCAMKGDSEMVTLLIDYGADPRDGVLYHIVSESVRNSTKSDGLVKVYRTIIDQAEKWSRFRSNEEKTVKNVFREVGIINSALALENKCNFKNHISENIIRLLNESSENYGCLSVIEHAVDEGAVSLLKTILHTEQLYDKVSETKEAYRLMIENCISREGGFTCNIKRHFRKCALVERIVNHEDEKVGARMLNIEPIKSIAMGYRSFAHAFYGLLALAQIIYMTCFTIFHIPNKCRFEIGRGAKHFECNISTQYYQNHFSHRYSNKSSTCVYVIWPLILLVSGILYSIRNFLSRYRRIEWSGIWSNAFPISAIVWLCIFQYPEANYSNYIASTALVFIIGWLHVFYYISFFKRFYIFSSLLKEIIVKDVVNFVVLMAIILLGFSCAIVTLYQTEEPGDYSYRSLTGTAYRAFFDTLSPGSTYLNETTNDALSEYQNKGGKLHLLRVIIITYEILTCVILMNILIAMMSDTYNRKIEHAEHTAQLSLIKTAINLKCCWPFGSDKSDKHVYLHEDIVIKVIGLRKVRKSKKTIAQLFQGRLKQSKNFLTGKRPVVQACP